MNLARLAHVLVGLGVALGVVAPTAARAEPMAIERGPLKLSAAEVLKRARAGAPEVRVARTREDIARTDVEVTRILPNPTIIAGTNSQVARLSIGASMPLPILGQRGATIAASRADLETAHIDVEASWNDVRAAAARAYIALWLAQEMATARAQGSAIIAGRIDDVVSSRVELGASPNVDRLRTKAERLRAEADAHQAEALVDAAASQLAFYLGSEQLIRADGEYAVPADAPALSGLSARIAASPPVRRENSDARAADARVDRERALVRPTPVIEVGADLGDPTLPATNYRGSLAIDVPLFSWRGAQIDRERAAAASARARAATELARGRAALTAAYYTFLAADGRVKTLRDDVLVAAEAAAVATQESYELGRAQLVAVLDASRARLDTRIALVDAIATRALAWVDIERAVGSP